MGINQTTEAKKKSLMGYVEKTTAAKKEISVLYLALGITAKKTIRDNFPTVNIAKITLSELITRFKQCFEKPKNETLDRFKLLRDSSGTN